MKPGLVFALQELPLADTFGSQTSTADLNHNDCPDVILEDGAILLDGATLIRLPGPGGSPIVADLNRDGHQDVVAIDRWEGRTLRVFFGDGRGGFPTAAAVGSWNAETEARHVVAADMNRDGSLDLLVTMADWRLRTAAMHTYTGRGDGTFVLTAVTPMPQGTNALMTADIDRDGRTDVLLSMIRDGVNDLVLRVLFGNGTGGFPRTVDYPTPANITDLAVADLNHDGRPDVVGVSWDLLIVMLGTADGGLGTAQSTPNEAYRLALGDINEDGHVDVVVNRLPGILFGNGDGTFSAQQGLAGWTSGIAVADMNRDGLADIVLDGSNAVLLNRRSQTNTPPVANAGPDITLTYRDTFNDDEEDMFVISGWESFDTDQHSLTYEWRDPSGNVISTNGAFPVPRFLPGTYEITLRVSDGRGGSAEDRMTLTITPVKEIVLHAVHGGGIVGDWTYEADSTAASGYRTFSPDRGAAKVNTPAAEPENYFDMWFIADPTQEYKLWIRGKALNNHWANDSAWVQFELSTDANGGPAYRIGTTSALPFNLEECSGCGLSGWGWEDDGWGAVNQNGVTLRFAQGGWQRIRIQTREDGLSIDQVVLSSERYKTVRPGTAKNDTTILPWTR